MEHKYLLIFVRLWNFKPRFLAKNYNAQRKPLYFGNTMSDSLAKSDEIILSTSKII